MQTFTSVPHGSVLFATPHVQDVNRPPQANPPLLDSGLYQLAPVSLRTSGRAGLWILRCGL